VSTADIYLQYANECLHSARNARSDDTREQFLEMAKIWMEAAALLHDGVNMLALGPEHAAKPLG
jgi:hypothetical protein